MDKRDDPTPSYPYKAQVQTRGFLCMEDQQSPIPTHLPSPYHQGYPRERQGPILKRGKKNPFCHEWPWDCSWKVSLWGTNPGKTSSHPHIPTFPPFKPPALTKGGAKVPIQLGTSDITTHSHCWGNWCNVKRSILLKNTTQPCLGIELTTSWMRAWCANHISCLFTNWLEITNTDKYVPHMIDGPSGSMGVEWAEGSANALYSSLGLTPNPVNESRKMETVLKPIGYCSFL